MKSVIVLLIAAGLASACSSTSSSSNDLDAATSSVDASADRSAEAAAHTDAGLHSSTANEAGAPGPISDGGPCILGAAPTTSGVAPAKAVEDFSDADREAFCAWAAEIYGGYGCNTTCSGGVDRSFSANLTDCKANFTRPGCKATARELESCTSKDAHDVCQLAIFDAVECAAWSECMRL